MFYLNCQNCAQAMYAMIKDVFLGMGIVILVLVVFQFGAIVSAVCLARELSNNYVVV